LGPRCSFPATSAPARPEQHPCAESGTAACDDVVRGAALDLAGAFSNDGFKIRDGHWSGMIRPKEHTLIAVNLYAGNHYWFSVGATEKAKKLAVSVYDESGQQVVTESYSAGDKAAAGFSPANSGQYYVSVGLIEGEESGVCFLYSYK